MSTVDLHYKSVFARDEIDDVLTDRSLSTGSASAKLASAKLLLNELLSLSGCTLQPTRTLNLIAKPGW